MKTYKEALADILEAKPEAAEIIRAHVASLNAESAERRVSLNEASKVVEALKALAGDDADLVKFASEAKSKSEASEQNLTKLQEQLDAALLLAATNERRFLLLKAAQKSGADPDALTKLLEAVPNDKIAVDESVTVEGKPLKDFAISQGKFWESALFSGTSVTQQVPTGGASPEVPKTPAVSYLETQAAALARDLGLSK